MPNIHLITGVPRSGTSLTLKLLSESPNSICLSEPSWLRTLRFEGHTAEQFSDALSVKITAVLAQVKAGNPIEVTVAKGSKNIPDNYYRKVNGKVLNVKQTDLVHYEYKSDMNLFVKSNTLFTACLKQLLYCPQWQVSCVIRNPLYVLLSWQSLNIPVSKGKIKIGELYSSHVRKISQIDDLLDRQIAILNWFFDCYKKCQVSAIKYEDLVASPQTLLFEHFTVLTAANKNLVNNNQIARYEIEKIKQIKLKLIKNCDLFNGFGYDTGFKIDD